MICSLNISEDGGVIPMEPAVLLVAAVYKYENSEDYG